MLPESAAASATALPHEAQRALRWLRAAVVLALAVPALIFAAVAWNAWREAFDNAERHVERTASVAAEHALRVFDTSRALLDRVFDLIGDDDASALLARERQIHERLVQMSRPLPQLQSIWIFDAQGNALAGNRYYPRPAALNIADRDFYKWHAQGRGGEYVTETLIGKVTNQPFFDLSRRRETVDGRFAGLVSVGLHPGYFADFYGRLPGAENTAVTLLRRDGAFIARSPQMPEVGRRLDAAHPLLRELDAGRSAGLIRGAGLVDDADRIGAFRVVEGHPLVVVATIERSAVAAAWLRDVALLAAFTFPTALALAWVAWVAYGRARRELALAAQLQQESALRQRVEEALRQSQKLEAMGRLTGGVAHDFNNLLSVISNNVFLMRKLQPEAGEAPPLAAIERAVASGVKLTRQLLAFSRRQPLAPQRVLLQRSLPALHDLLRSALGSGVRLAIEVDPRCPPIRIDSAEFELALLNLAVNARDAMPDGGTLTIRAAGDDEGGTAGVRIEVADTGAGMAPELRAHVFEPFFTTKPPGQGTGLGLAQVWGFMRRAGGSVEVESEPGRGSVFRLHFPAAEADGDAAPDDTSAQSAAPAEPLRCRVLLVEDNEPVRQAMREVLEAMGCTVHQAASGDEALAALSAPQGIAGEIDVVLSDIQMPGQTDGVALAEWLRRTWPQLPVVLITGYSRQIDAQLQQRFQVLAKPCSADDLRVALLRALREGEATAAPPPAEPAMPQA